ncbi:MAG: DUF5103 domain-containing protein [Bacteroidales bacterium]|nr:DUF5103 domain-containing protein [Bacteroidales bacterium]
MYFSIKLPMRIGHILLAAMILCSGLYAQTAAGFGSVQAVSSNKDYENLPIINLKGGDYLNVSFDDLQDRDMSLRYRVVLLNTDGSVSDLREIEYFSGINKTDITEVDFSFNTRSNYVHYSFRFPDKGRSLKLSGAYRFEIFRTEAPDKVLLRIPFMVCEPSLQIATEIKVPTRVEWRRSRQELAVTVDAAKSPLRITQADRCLQVYAQQNLNTLSIRRLPLLFQVGSRFEFKDKTEMVFDGLNEFRNLDIRPVNYAGRGVERIHVAGQRWNALLERQKSREYTPYVDNDDINGNFVIKAENMDNSDLEAEYVNVHFVLEAENQPLQEYFVIGKFNGWQCDEQSRMSYLPGQKAYTLSLPLKQGFYDYMFACRTDGQLHIPYVEGNCQETENDYYVYVFYREPGGRYDRFIGFDKTNSRTKP